jgi:hypothetical protein
MKELDFYIDDSARTAKRKQIKTLGNSAIAYIVELITNADDSYRRLEAQGLIDKVSMKKIFIDIHDSRGSTLVSVTDNAEGLSEQRIKDIFSGRSYGADNSGGEETSSRGIFGQGATDVMVNSAMDGKKAMLESFKDNEYSKFHFHWDKENAKRILKQKTVKLNHNQIYEKRKELKIPVNGSRMTFGIPSSIKFKQKTIIDDLSGAYSLRYILNSTNRNVILSLNGVDHVLSSSKYDISNLPIIKKSTFSFNFDGVDITCNLELRENNNKQDESDYSSKILVRDKNFNIYANTLFGFEKTPRANSISGVLILDGIYSLAKKHLNKENPEEIINDDRTGFNLKSDFYKLLTNKYLDPLIRESLSTLKGTLENFDFSNNKKIKDLLGDLNKWFSEELKRDIPGGNEIGLSAPSDGLSFNRNSITITKGKTYSLKLVINSLLILQSEDIFVETVNNDGFVEFSPEVINYKNTDIYGDNIVVKTQKVFITRVNSQSGIRE